MFPLLPRPRRERPWFALSESETGGGREGGGRRACGKWARGNRAHVQGDLKAK